MKTCTKCKIEKPLSDFGIKSCAKDGLRSACKLCTNAWSKEKYDSDKPKKLAMNKRYYEANSEKVILRTSGWHKKNKAAASAKVRRWQISNPEKVAAIDRNRRARKKMAAGRHSAADVLEIFNRQKGLCASCLLPLIFIGKGRYHVDHILPLSKGGSNDKYNLQCLCPACNFSKNAKDPIEWAQQNGRLL